LLPVRSSVARRISAPVAGRARLFYVTGMEAAPLLEVAGAYSDAQARAWLERALPSAAEAFARGAWFGAYAGAARRFAQPIELTTEHREQLRAAGVAVPEVWSLADFARAALLLAACVAAPEPEHVSIATEVFRKGDNAERVALLRTLALLPQPERFAPLAVEACRTHVLDVFAAIACDNPFPAAWFPELNFNQLVIKSLFMELPLPRVLGWRGRCNPELVRIAGDYEAERRAAGRAVPADIALIKAAHVTV
jgi:hypothetical protein